MVTQVPIQHQRVVVRVDFNVPLENETIVDDYRLRAFLPTLCYLLQQNARVVLITHLGKPLSIDPALSTRILLPWFIARGFNIIHAQDIEHAKQVMKESSPQIILLENLRFFAGEREHDYAFAEQLADLGTVYVNDAFGALHRDDSSLTITPTFFGQDKRCIGLLVAQELQKLAPLLHADHPFTVIIGGGKLKTKIPLIQAMIPKADNILLCPALAFTFLASQHRDVGASLVDPSLFELCREILNNAARSKTKIHLPIDYMVSKNVLQPPYTTISAQSFTADDYGVGVGSQTLAQWSEIIAQSKTIFYNGLMGDLSVPASIKSTIALFSLLAHSPAYTVVAGGDSVGCAIQHHFEYAIGFLSTGGGATLAYLAGQELPGLMVLKTA